MGLWLFIGVAHPPSNFRQRNLRKQHHAMRGNESFDN